jgi:hypothetical protein
MCQGFIHIRKGGSVMSVVARGNAGVTMEIGPIDMDMLKEQKQILLETIWDIEEQDKRFKLWGIVEMIDYIQEVHERE